jgi:hypothetical protein
MIPSLMVLQAYFKTYLQTCNEKYASKLNNNEKKYSIFNVMCSVGWISFFWDIC